MPPRAPLPALPATRRGQAAVELVAVALLALGGALGGLHLLVAAWGRVEAGAAATAGARALALGGDPAPAARAALAASLRRPATVRRRRDGVEVVVRLPLAGEVSAWRR